MQTKMHHAQAAAACQGSSRCKGSSMQIAVAAFQGNSSNSVESRSPCSCHRTCKGSSMQRQLLQQHAKAAVHAVATAHAEAEVT